MTGRPPRPPWSAARLIYTGLGLGLSPKAPGTCGTLLGVPLFWLAGDEPWPVQAGLWILVFSLGWWAARRAETELGVHDSPQVVIDEVAGYLTTVFLAPNGPATWILGFALFRFFDILKPWPVGWADRCLPGGFGVMADDILAGLYAWLFLRLAMNLAPGWF
ncbi:MAG: phosphatidylglycerophosphatase A [Candidatus Adiutrix sp.]|jgi:phosphatidylglycerophosphatase A|nr:phosphatidylglycerophosphatase A [Candidatus Adiutrix sp.]